jgi:hypothetical protein
VYFAFFPEPREEGVMLRRFDWLAYVDPAPRPWLIHAMGLLNRHVVLPHVLKVRAIDLPALDAARLQRAVHEGTVAFLAPNHPEFTTDWMLDKELSRRVSPMMAHWAAYDIVNASPLAQRFWLANHLISNAPGGGGKAYSIARAMAGDGVLLHPEGTATWCGDRIAPLVPGIADLAWGAWSRLRREAGSSLPEPRLARDRPVFVVPVVWKLHFERDVSAALAREIAHIARRLALAVPRSGTLEARFAALHCGVLATRCARFAFAVPAPQPESFFDTQDTLARHLIGLLAARHGEPRGPIERWLHGIRRAIRERDQGERSRFAGDAALVREVDRLRRFTREHYPDPALTQEQIAESLKQLHASLVTRSGLDALRNLVPVAVAPRIARIRVPEPLDAAAFFANTSEADGKARLLAALEGRMRHALDAVNEEIAESVSPFSRPNPFLPASAPRAGSTHRERGVFDPLHRVLGAAEASCRD